MPDLTFDGKVAIVTGAGNGLGRSHALLLASRGARVVVNDLGGSVSGEGEARGPADSVVEEIRATGGQAVANASTVATADGAQEIVITALEAFGQLDILVNNAGILRNAPLEDMTAELVQRLVDVHLLGTFHVTKAAWPALKSSGVSRVVNTTSTAALLGNAGMSNYAAAKGGVYGLTRVLAIEGIKYGIAVNAIAPYAATRMLTESMSESIDVMNETILEQVRSLIDVFEPGLVSAVVAFLAHPDCPVTGEVYSAGGGSVSRLFLGRTRGIYRSTLTVEEVRDNLAEIRSTDEFTVPVDTGDESRLMFEAMANPS